MMETPTINARLRERMGTRYSRRDRSQGRLPAVIYGHGSKPVHVTVDETEALTHLHDGAHVVNLSVDGGENATCLVKDLQFGYLGDNVIHIDFARVDLDEEVEVKVHLHFVGAPKEAGKPGSIVTHDIMELEVICKVIAIPEEIRVDLSKMEGMRLDVRDITLPEGVRSAVPLDAPVVRIEIVKEEEELGEAAVVEATATAEPEVLTETAKKARDAAAAAEKKDE